MGYCRVVLRFREHNFSGSCSPVVCPTEGSRASDSGPSGTVGMWEPEDGRSRRDRGRAEVGPDAEDQCPTQRGKTGTRRVRGVSAGSVRLACTEVSWSGTSTRTAAQSCLPSRPTPGAQECGVPSVSPSGPGLGQTPLLPVTPLHDPWSCDGGPGTNRSLFVPELFSRFA